MQQHCSGDQDHRVGDEHEDAQIQPRKRPLQRPSEGGGAAHSPACAQDLARTRERQYALDIEENEYISDVFLTTPDIDRVHLQITVDGDPAQNKTITVKTLDDQILYKTETKENKPQKG